MNLKAKIYSLTIIVILSTLCLLSSAVHIIFGLPFWGAFMLFSGIYLFIGYPLNNITMSKRISKEIDLYNEATKYIEAHNKQFITINCEGCKAINDVEVTLDSDETIFKCEKCGVKNRIARTYITTLMTEIANG